MRSRRHLVQLGDPGLSIRKQCALLGINRNHLYYRPVPEKPENVEMMRCMDAHLLRYPTEGVRSMVLYWKSRGIRVSPKRIRRLFRIMGHQTIYRRKNLSKLGLKKYIRPYLLRNLDITRANQVWCTDITFIPMKKGFMYLTAIMEVYSRKILSYGISNSLETEWCLRVLEDAIARYGAPEIINTDQGSQYTSALWTQYLEHRGIQISMDGKGRATDNTWIERFWKTIKYNHIYLNPVEDGIELYQGISEYMDYYNDKIHHTTKMTPEKRYDQSMKEMAA